ncbi:MAG TPA: transglycosylase domain-containing protein [Acidobacteriaceae bacterium]
MPVKVKLGRKNRSFLWRVGRFCALVFLIGLVIFAIGFGIAFHHYQGVVDDRLAHGPLFAQVAQIYAAPQEVRPGQQLTAASIAASLRRAGYNANPQLGNYQLRDDTILIKPGPQSYHSTDGATITTTDGQVQSITAENGVALKSYQLEPQLITALSEDKNRTKRRLVTYKDIPPNMVRAVVSIEDHSFFTHSGVNYPRLLKCAVIDTFDEGRPCGGSTLTMQLARGFFLTPARTKKRKLEEIMITYQLESRFNKEQIFEMYANQINLGQRGSFAINGFGEAAEAFFGKDLRQLDLAECAMLAGIVNSPNKLNPYRHADRAIARRNLVLDQMVETNSITAAEAERAKAEALRLAPPNVDASEAPYFVDLVHDQIVQRVGDQELSHDNLRIYTSLDPELQRAASDAVDAGMKHVDDLVRAHYKKGATNITYPQVALIALNPHTGQVLALVGGRNYGVSQLDHATTKRPTGSIFKPFVYATAEVDTVNNQPLPSGPFTALTILHDVPTTFTFDEGRQTYAPRNYKDEFHGDVTAAYALAHSLNNATVSLGQQVGFENVAALGRASGVPGVRGTPSVALGAYDATPLDMAGAYTVFANGGVHLSPWLLASVRNANGDIVADFAPEARQVMDPRAAFLAQSLLEGVMNFGYGVEVRKRGFTAPAAGKTGTDHDAWFAAYSSNLICIVWVGNDDYTDVRMSGALAAAPIWAEFMNRAIKLPQYSDMTSFRVPDGVEVLRIDRATSLPADDTCPSDTFSAAFLDGTAPQGTCSHMGQDTQTLGSKIFGANAPPQDPNNPATPDGQPHRNVFQKLFGLGKDKQPQPQPPPQ